MFSVYSADILLDSALVVSCAAFSLEAATTSSRAAFSLEAAQFCRLFSWVWSCLFVLTPVMGWAGSLLCLGAAAWATSNSTRRRRIGSAQDADTFNILNKLHIV